MFHIGDELTIETNTIPWLILSQLLVLLLLCAIIFVFAVVPSDPDANAVTAATLPPSASSNVFFLNEIQQIDFPPANNHSSSTDLTTRQRHSPQDGQNLLIKGEVATGSNPSTRREEIVEEKEEEEEASSLHFHPCHYFQLATGAFLKCIGLDSTSDTPSTPRNRKRKKS
ncbi:hypothetical protein VNO78_01985 [Psophocarpus tetragonolobus]|uniref:Uncharacterized protein n=1 Tax=Psophocarpus tetragonolobus TaxID=3891 RepID=A0AAN9TAV9_PSOTE